MFRRSPRRAGVCPNSKINGLMMCIKTCSDYRSRFIGLPMESGDVLAHLWDVKRSWSIFIISLIGIFLSCGSSPTKNENHEQNVEQPNLKNMVLIPAGEFLMGSPEGEGAFDEHPQHKVYLDAFYIDKYEVTNAQFKEFVEATGYITDAERKGIGECWNPKEMPIHPNDYLGVNWQYPNGWYTNRPYPDVWGPCNEVSTNYCRSRYFDINHPVVQVSWNDAVAYATWDGKRLPTEAEWEKAARGTDGRRWPWGNAFHLDINGVTAHANIASDGLVPVGSFTTGVSPYGVYNMLGNVQEWVADWYAPDYYAYSPRNNPKGPEYGTFLVLRGGSWRHQKDYQVYSANREYQTPNYSSNFMGFRCAWSESPLNQK